MRKRTIILVCFICLLVFMAGCNKNCKRDKNKNDDEIASVESVYGMGFVTTAKLLDFSSEKTATTKVSKTQLASESNDKYDLPYYGLTVEQVMLTAEEFNRYFNMIDDFLDKSSIKTTVEENTETDPLFSEYKYKLTINSKNEKGENITHTMYYSETVASSTQDNEKTSKIYNVTGVVALTATADQPNYYYMNGRRTEETEQEGKDVETENKLWLKASLEKDDNNLGNYVIMEYEVETEQENSMQEQETSYEYSIYQNGILSEKTKVSFEKENNEFEYEFEFETLSLINYYKIEKVTKNNETWIEVKYNLNNLMGKFVIVETNDGKYCYKFTNDSTDDRIFDKYD